MGAPSVAVATWALKLMRQQIGVDDSTVQRLTFEARAAARIQSKNDPRVLEVPSQ